MKIIAKQKPRLDARARQERSVLNLARHSNFLIHCRYYLETTQDREGSPSAYKSLFEHLSIRWSSSLKTGLT